MSVYISADEREKVWVLKKALDLGCESVEPPNVKDDDPDKRGTFKDFAGNIWSVVTQL